MRNCNFIATESLLQKDYKTHMGLFNKLFSKKDTNDKSGTTGDNTGYKAIRNLTDEQSERIYNSTLQLMATQLYMQYWTDNLVCIDPKDPEWQNKVLFFWKADEPFPKKSLPPVFETFQKKHFVFIGDASNISLEIGQAMPWFGMPGLGDKHVSVKNGQYITIPDLNKLGVVQYVEPIELTTANLDILTNRDQYFFLIDDSITPFQNGNFYHQGKPISIDVAYSIGGIQIMKNTELQ